MGKPQRLLVSARASILWGGGSTLLRDLAQFSVMLVLVRLLTPEDYGVAVLAQAVVGLLSVASFATYSSHALQIRDHATIDWQAHFSAATVINGLLAALVLVIAFGLTFTTSYAEISGPLAALSVVFIVEVPGTLRHRMLEAAHNWKRFRLLLLIGTFLGLGVGLIVAVIGGGVWALIVQIPMLGLPAAVDLLFIERFRPDWAWSWSRWRDTFRFGMDRMGSALAGRGRVLNEQVLVSKVYDLATLGILSRATGLAMILAGRLGSLAMISLHPVITRADSGSPRFRRLADLVLRGVIWVTVPSVTFICIAGHDIVALLYGSNWMSVAPLLPLAAVAVGLSSIISVLSNLLVANECSRTSLLIDVVGALGAIVVAIVLIPFGVWTYLAGLGAFGMVITVAAGVILLNRGAMTGRGIAAAFFPALVAAAAGATAITILRNAEAGSNWLLLRLLIESMLFATAYVLMLRLGFHRQFAEFLEVAPGGERLGRVLRVRSRLAE